MNRALNEIENEMDGIQQALRNIRDPLIDRIDAPRRNNNLRNLFARERRAAEVARQELARRMAVEHQPDKAKHSTRSNTLLTKFHTFVYDLNVNGVGRIEALGTKKDLVRIYSSFSHFFSVLDFSKKLAPSAALTLKII